MRIGLLGFGLIGGSVARAVRRASPESHIAAWSPSGEGPRLAFAAGVIDAAPRTVAGVVKGADLVILAAPPIASIDLLASLGGPVRGSVGDGATITDVVSTKALLLSAADAAGLHFVGGHPMAGRETTGYEAGDADLFVDRPWVVVPGASARRVDIERVEWLAAAAGARTIRMTAAEHDDAVAAISHLPLALSAALVEAVVGAADEGIGVRADWPRSKELAAGGWAGMTRLARGDVEMAAGIASTNAAPLARRLRDVRAVVEAWIADLDAVAGADPSAQGGEAARARLAARLRRARDRLTES